MPFPIPNKYESEAADVARDEAKRLESPPSFFFAQTQALLLSADYFKAERLKSSHAAVARKHRNRIRSALFGQLMASFEFCIKDFLAQVIDSSDAFDDVVSECKWIEIDKSRVLAQRDGGSSVGAMLIHPLLGWHDTDSVNERFRAFFERHLFDKTEAQHLQRLWILRHSVAHNGGFVTHHDAYRLQAPPLSRAAIAMGMEFLTETSTFLRSIVLKLEHGQPIGDKVVEQWFRKKATGIWTDDKDAYSRVRRVVTVVRKRTQPFPKVTKGMYSADRKRLTPPQVTTTN